jgi:hypothetical protein
MAKTNPWVLVIKQQGEKHLFLGITLVSSQIQNLTT